MAAAAATSATLMVNSPAARAVRPRPATTPRPVATSACVTTRFAPVAKMVTASGWIPLLILTAGAAVASATSTDNFAATAMDTEMETGTEIGAGVVMRHVAPIARPAATSMYGVIHFTLNARLVMANGAG